VLLEQQQSGLKKVLMSGGGRCNVMHDDEVPIAEFVENYPRGAKEVRGPFTKRFGPRDSRAFFESEGVELKVEADGRVFPVTDDSQTIATALTEAARREGVDVRFGEGVTDVSENLEVRTATSAYSATAVVLATGSAPRGYAIAQSLGHVVEAPYPSLFSFRVKGVTSLAGLSLKRARLVLDDVYEQTGPLLFTHRGLSGPCALKLSAFAARRLKELKYAGSLTLNALPDLSAEDALKELTAYKRDHPTQVVASPKKRPFADAVPKRLWQFLVADVVDGEATWARIDTKKLAALRDALTKRRLAFEGRDANKDEFVTAGGVSLSEVDPRTMRSKRLPGLHFAGELLDIDAVTGGCVFVSRVL